MALIATGAAAAVAVVSDITLAASINNVFYGFLQACDTIGYNNDDCDMLLLLTRSVASRFAHIAPQYLDSVPEITQALLRALQSGRAWCRKYRGFGRCKRFVFAARYATKFQRRQADITLLSAELHRWCAAYNWFQASSSEYSAPVTSEGSHSPSSL